MTARPAPVERTSVVTFRVGDQAYAVDVFAVERVLPWTPPRPIPNVPAWIEGVLDHAGRTVPVIDLRTRFDLPLAADRAKSRLLVFAVGDDRIAAAVDAVDEVAAVPTSTLEDPPAIFRGLARQYLKALFRRDGQVVVLLDIGQLLNSRERMVMDQAMAGVARG